jgi:hypothetical protein
MTARSPSVTPMGLLGAPAQYLRDAPNGSVATRRRHAGGPGCHRGGVQDRRAVPMAPMIVPPEGRSSHAGA